MHDAFNVSDKPVVSGLHDRIESLLLYGKCLSQHRRVWVDVYTPRNRRLTRDVPSHLNTAGRLFIGCQNGSLHVYTLELAAESENGQPTGELHST